MTAGKRAGARWLRPLAVIIIVLVGAATVVAAGGLGRSRSATPQPAVPLPSRLVRPSLAPPHDQGRQGLDCERCHGELELLRQQSGSLNRARQLHVPADTVAASAHGDLACTDCHAGFESYPHPSRGARTRTCASCHAAQDAAWQHGVHAAQETRESVRCAACHGVHDVRPVSAGDTAGVGLLLNARCLSCHESQRLPATDPHAGTVLCAACHDAHDIKSVADSAASTAPGQQARTCGACHDSIAHRWRQDVHGDGELGAAVRAAEQRVRPPAETQVVCTSCHGAHGILTPRDTAFAAIDVERCAACHPHAAATYFGTYHGKATVLGSTVVATCANCHGAHTIYPASDPRSSVAADHLVGTCGQCHEHARPAFVKYDSHPDPLNRHRDPPLFFSFVFMNTLLVGVLGVFGLHTGLWWLRLWLDRRRSPGNGGGGEA